MTELSRRELNRQTKVLRILDAALEQFARNGFSGTSMAAVAQQAGLTKPTLYQYFETKDALFSAVLNSRRDDMTLAIGAPDPERLVPQLHAFAWTYARTVLRPDLLSLARLVIGETARFPDIGRAYQAQGPDLLLVAIMDYIEAMQNAGRLRFDEAELMAQDLWGLILSAPRNRALHDPAWVPTQAELARYVHHGLRSFLRLYSVTPEKDVDTLSSLILQD